METRSAHLRNLRGQTREELEAKAKELKKDLFNLRFQLVTGRIENPAKIKQTRREIARLKTVTVEQVHQAGGRGAKKGPAAK